jgi:hypothetical protein
MNKQARISINEIHPDDEFVQIRIRADDEFQNTVITAEVPITEFAKTLFGLADVPCELAIKVYHKSIPGGKRNET